MSLRTTPPFRADHVGSFLRPPELLAARDRFAKGEITRAALRVEEDAAIRDVVRFQEDLGLSGITDGEFRRTYFHIDFLEQLAGVETKGGIAVSFHSAKGNVDFAPPVMKVTGPVRHVKPIPSIEVVGEVVNEALKAFPAEVQVVAENPITGQRIHTNTAYLVFVAIDDNGTPVPVPPLLAENPAEKAHMEAARQRHERRLAERKAAETK